MEPFFIGIAGVCAMLCLFFTRMPVAYVMLLTGFTGFSLVGSYKGGMNLLAQDIYGTFFSYTLSTIPLFILMGQLAFHSGISRKLFRTAYYFLGHIRGGMAMATISSCTAFGAVCGSSPATAATMTTVALPEMKQYGYANSLATGSIASGGSMGMIMPPSVVLIIYGVLTEQNIEALFMAGFIPSLLLTLLFIAAIFLVCRKNPALGPAGPSFTLKEKLGSLSGLVDAGLIFFLVIGGMFWGWFTPTQAASIGVLGIMALAAVRGRLTIKILVRSLHETLLSSCMVLFLVAGATVFGKFLARTRIPFELANLVTILDLPDFMVITLILVLCFIGGCLMDALALIMLTIPIFFPLIAGMGYDPIWFGIIIVLITQIGVITPPVGINVYVVFGAAKALAPELTLQSIFKGTVPFLLALLAGLMLFMLFPDIITFLPSLME